MQYRLTVFALVLIAGPLVAQSDDPLAYLQRDANPTDTAFSAYRSTPYQPVRPGEVRSAGFLTEQRSLPFGQVLGAVDPEQVHAAQSLEVMLAGSLIAVVPPNGAAYQAGDTLVIARRIPGPEGWGDIVIPTGLAQVGDHTPRQTMARVIAMYGAIRTGDVTLPIEPVASSSGETPADVAGPRGTIIAGQQPHELTQAGTDMFIDMGRAAGIRIGDFVQVRRRPTARLDAPDTIDELMAVGQVVHVGEKTSTIKLTRVIDPDIRPGTPVVRTATLPN
jgi:hypothetical protein